MADFLRAFRSGLRTWRATPGVAAGAIGALSLGIGFTTTMFGIVHAVARPLPVPAPEQVVAVSKAPSRGATAGLLVRAADLVAWQHARLTTLAAFQTWAVNLAGEAAQPERVPAARLTANALSTLGVAVRVGRGFSEADTQSDAAPVVVLSDTLWRRRFGGDAGIVGRAIRLDGRGHEVIGIAPPGFGFPVNAALWVPLALPATSQPGGGPILTVFGRLVGGVSAEAARAEIETLTLAGSTRTGDGTGDVGVNVIPFTEIETPREVLRGLRFLLIGVSSVLLIACGNVASLLTAHGEARARDVATRLALGAGHRRLIAEQVGEALILALAASVVGLGIAAVALDLFEAYTANVIEAYWVDFALDGRVALVGGGLALVAGLAAALGPAMRSSAASIVDVLRDGSGATALRISRVGRSLPAVQIAMASGLLALTILLGRAAADLRATPWPFDADRVLSAELGFTEAILDDRDRRDRMFRALEGTLASQPGVTAGLVSAIPGRGSGAWPFSLDEPLDPARASAFQTNLAQVSPGFFDVLRGRALAGRVFTWQDDRTAEPVAIANVSFARRFSADQDPIGRRVYVRGAAFTIVGIVPDLMAGDIQDRAQDALYVPILQLRPYIVRVVVSGASPASDMERHIRAAAAQVDRDLPVAEVFTVKEAALRDKAVLEILGVLFLIFGVGALGLTAVGLYGVVSFNVSRRVREIGVRTALGATPADIARLIARDGIRQSAIGLAGGVVLAMALTRGFAAAVEGAPQADTPVIAVVVALVAFTTVAALCVPTLRAMTLQVAETLRHR
jgi:predicted permease